MAQYKNISKETLSLIGVGTFSPDEVFETDKEINNPNFIKINEVQVEELKVEKKEEEIKIKKVK